MAVDSSRYHAHRVERLEAFVVALARYVPLETIAELAQDTAPAGWAIDLGRNPSAAAIAQALEEGDIDITLPGMVAGTGFSSEGVDRALAGLRDEAFAEDDPLQ